MQIPSALMSCGASGRPLQFGTAARRRMIAPALAGLLATPVVVLLGPWSIPHRLVLIACTLVGGLCIALELAVPWERLSHAAYIPLPVLGLLDVGLGMWASGGWTSPFTAFLAVPTAFAIMSTDLLYALPVAIIAGLVTASPGLYSRHGSFLIVSLAAIPAYITLTAMIDVIVWHLRDSDRLATLETEARRQSEARTQDLVALQRVFAIVAMHLSMDDAIAAIVRELSATMGHRLIAIYLLQDGRLWMQAQMGYTSWHDVMDVGQGVIGTACARNETIFLRDVTASELYLEAAENVVSEIAIPLRDEGHVVGVLNIEGREPLDDRDLDLLELFGAQFSVVMHNARLAGELRTRAEHDSLTELLNHRSLYEVLERTLEVGAGGCAVLVADLDSFKQVNDRFGHIVGDGVLRHVAGILTESCREGDCLGRCGGDEFVVVLPGADYVTAAAVADRILEAAAARPYLDINDTRVAISLSMGIAVASEDGLTPTALLDAADRQMYSVKWTRALA